MQKNWDEKMVKGFVWTETPAPLRFQLNICNVVRIGEYSMAADVIQDTSAAFFDFGPKSKFNEHDKNGL